MCAEAGERLNPPMGLSQAGIIIPSHTQLGRWARSRVQLHKAPAPSAASLLRTPGGPDSLEASGMLPARARSPHVSLSTLLGNCPVVKGPGDKPQDHRPSLSIKSREIVQVCAHAHAHTHMHAHVYTHFARAHVGSVVSEGHRCQMNDFQYPRLEPPEQESE